MSEIHTEVDTMAIEAIKSAATSMAVKPVEIKPVTIEPVTAAVAQPNVAVKEVQGSAKNNASEEKGHAPQRTKRILPCPPSAKA